MQTRSFSIRTQRQEEQNFQTAESEIEEKIVEMFFESRRRRRTATNGNFRFELKQKTDCWGGGGGVTREVEELLVTGDLN